MNILKLLGLTVGLVVASVSLIFTFLFCYDGHLFYFSKPAQVEQEFHYLIPSAPSKFDAIFEIGKSRGGSIETATGRMSGGIVQFKFSYSSVYDEKSGKIYYKFRNDSREAVYIKSVTLRRLTGGLWRIPADSTLYLIFPGPPAEKAESERLDLLYEEKILGINFKFSVFGSSVELIVPFILPQN